ncbi:MAG: GDP-L-fucose synthase family protein [Planctomycetaceae bacterium]
MLKPIRRIFVAGHRGMVGAAVCRRLADEPDIAIVTATRSELDLTDRRSVDHFFATSKIDVVIFAAARVGGIVANNTYPVEFLTDNINMAVNTISSAYEHRVPRFLFLGSTCVYPRNCPQPIREEYLLTGSLEPTNEAYAIAKIAGVKLCEYYRRQYGVFYTSAMPTNLYGPGDNYHAENSHVLPGLIRRFHEAAIRNEPVVRIWGTGTPRREFLHVDDLADALVHLIDIHDVPDWINIGTGRDLSIMELAQQIAEVVGFDGEIATDPTRPDGTPIKCTDVSRLSATGWQARIDLREGLKQTVKAYLRETIGGVLRAV